MFRWLLLSFILLLSSCAGTLPPDTASTTTVELQGKQLYIVPFETIMVPAEVSANLFDLFVDRLNQQGADRGVEFIILKQGLAEIDPGWLAGRNYLRGEIFAYIEEVGSSMTDIKARSRIRLYRSGRSLPALQLTFPAEIFYQNDYSSLPIERHKLAVQIAETLADRLLAAIITR